MFRIQFKIVSCFEVHVPAADLAVAAALVSSLAGKPLPAESVWFGEISLSGAVRPVSHRVARLREAKKLGFTKGFAPTDSQERDQGPFEIREFDDLAAMTAMILAG